MEMFEALISHCAAEINGSTTVEWNDHTIDLSTPWERLTMQDAIEHYAGVDVRDMGDDELRTYCQTNGIDYEPDYPRGLLIEAIFEHSVEDELIQPTFITDFPEETTPLCKQLRDGDDTFVERFEPYIAGMEVGNAYSELNDPQKQREQFEAQRDDDDEAHPVDDDFIEALEHGMPPTSGVGVGVDRIVMLLTGQESIRDVILFPTLKQRYEDDE
jgi:lysyl-tRNA synthetase class 2